MSERFVNGAKTFYQDLLGGIKIPCGVSLDLSRIDPKIAAKIIASESKQPEARIIQFMDDQSAPYELSPGEKERLLQNLNDESEGRIVVLYPAMSFDDIVRRTVKHKKYAVEMRGDSIAEVFATQDMSNRQRKRLIRKLSKNNNGSTLIVTQSRQRGASVFSPDPTDKSLAEAVKNADAIIVRHDVFFRR